MALLALPLGTSCIDLTRPAPDVRYYALEPAPLPSEDTGSPADSVDRQAVLLLRPFGSSARSQEEGFVHRLGAHEFESDYYHRWFRAPATMLANAVRSWTARSAQFQAVIDSGSLLTPTHTLEGQLLELHADFTSDPPSVVLGFGVFVLDETEASRPLLLSREYRHVIDSRSGAPGDLVAAWGHALELGLSELELDLASLFQ